jgi:hypothetical protein
MGRDRLGLGINLLLLATAVWVGVSGLNAIVSRHAPAVRTAQTIVPSHAG